MSEKDFRKEVIKLLAPLDAVPIESALVTSRLIGIPDVNFAGGWAELKILKSWPKRETTPVKIDHYTPEQKLWSFRRSKAGEEVWFLLKVRTEWLLLDSKNSQLVGTLTKQQLIDSSAKYWSTRPTSYELCSALKRRS